METARARGRTALAGVLAAIVCGVVAAPASATVVCQQGTTNPNYCTDYPPTAVTRPATGVHDKSATLNGIAGPTIANGDVTSYFFKYGRTRGYGHSTRPGHVGSCPSGKSGVAFCSSPATKSVSYKVRGLVPCTNYHFRIFASNRDGTAAGSDRQFRTRFEAPIGWVRAPAKVSRSRRRHTHHFRVTVKLVTPAHVSILLLQRVRRHHRVIVRTVESHYFKGYRSGKVHATFTSPGHAGTYTIHTKATLKCGSEAINKRIRVH
jgi:hypothetical protein